MERTTLPRRLEQELRRSARPGLADDACKWMERHLKARAGGDLKEARRAAVRAKQAAPRSTTVREALGTAAFESGDYREAVQELMAFRRLTGARHNDPAIAEAYRRLGRPERALDFLEDLRRGDVSERVWADAQIVRAGALADRGMRDAAIAIIDRAARGAGPFARARLHAARTELGERDA